MLSYTSFRDLDDKICMSNLVLHVIKTVILPTTRVYMPLWHCHLKNSGLADYRDFLMTCEFFFSTGF